MVFHLIIRLCGDFLGKTRWVFLDDSHPFQPSDSDPPNVLPETLQFLLLIATSQGSWPSRNASVCRSALDQAAFAKRQTKNERVLEKELGWSVRFFDGICITLKCICTFMCGCNIYIHIYILYVCIWKYIMLCFLDVLASNFQRQNFQVPKICHKNNLGDGIWKP